MKKVSEGAEAEIYETSLFGVPVVVKERVAKTYRVQALDTELREQRTKTESRILARASSNNVNTPKVLLLNKYQIFMDKLSGTMLNLLIRRKPQKQIARIITMCGEQLGMLHKLGVAHGDYTPANIMVDSNGKVWVIDFGLGEMTNSAESRALDILLMKRSISKVLYKKFTIGYLAKTGKAGNGVLSKLAEIEKRGRYQTRTLA